MDTLSSIRAEIINWMRGDLSTVDDQPIVNAAINDAIEDIWASMMPFQLARFFGLDAPVTFTLPSGAERVQLVSIPDPTVAPTVGSFAGGTLTARTYLVSYTYVTESGTETLPSPTTSQAIGLNSLAQITNPAAVANAIGWNCYVSVSNTAGLMGLQNQNPLPFGAVFRESSAGFVDYPSAQQQPGAIQAASQATPAAQTPPNENSTADNISWILHMEVRTSDTLLRTWHQYDIDSELMTRYGRQLSSASEYQSYVWDIINGNRLEVRPSAGQAFTPRYFYIAKPRRLRYDQARVPYTEISGVHEFVVAKAVAKLKLALDEYLGHQAWSGDAAAKKQVIIDALRTEDWGKDLRIAPHLF
jgi:hypothetical protein